MERGSPPRLAVRLCLWRNSPGALPALPPQGLSWRVGPSYPTREAPAGASARGLCGARWRGPPTHCTQEPPRAHPATLLQAHGRPPPLPAPHSPRPAPAEGLYWAQFPTRLSPQEAHCRGNGWARIPVQGSAEGSAGMSTPLSAWFQTVPWAALGCAPQLPCPKTEPRGGREGGITLP